MFFFFNDTATTEIYTLSLHDALPIYRMHLVEDHRLHAAERFARLRGEHEKERLGGRDEDVGRCAGQRPALVRRRSEEHTSELQSRQYLVCRLLLEKKNTQK